MIKSFAFGEHCMQRLVIMVLSLLVAGSAFHVSAQVQLFDNPKADYTFELPSPNWRLLSSVEDLSQGLEFINGPDRSEGFLKIRKQLVDKGVTPMELARRDQDQGLRYQPGYVDGSTENFAGRLSGVILNYEYSSGGKPMAGRIYYLQADPLTIYTLRFTGSRTKLSLMRSQVDIIARSFKLR
jgi:hypothetical protein